MNAEDLHCAVLGIRRPSHYKAEIEQLKAEIDALKAQNAELLAALEHLVAAIEFTPLSIRALTHLAVARKAIAKARGDQV